MPSEIDESSVLSIERLRDDLADFHRRLKARYRSEDRQVVAPQLRQEAAALAEKGTIELAGRSDLAAAIPLDRLADLATRFQRLLSWSERATIRSKYDVEIKAVLRGYQARIVIPLKQYIRDRPMSVPTPVASPAQAAFQPTAFVGHSFAPADRKVVEYVIATLKAIGLVIKTGEKPAVGSVSAKVRRRIEAQSIFVGIFSRRERVARGTDWTTSNWVIDEKAYAFGLGKKLLLLKEEGVGSIGGIQGDSEYVEFSKSHLHDLGLRLLQLFEVTPIGFQS